MLSKILKKSADEFLNSPAFTMQYGYRKITYSFDEIYKLSCRVALFLESNGIQKGDCVVVCAPNSPYWISLFWGCMLKGAVIVPMMIQNSSQMVDKVIAQTDAKMFFTFRFSSIKLQAKINTFFLEYIEDLVEDFKPENFVETEVFLSDLAEILYTSGTTGEPKGVMLTHENLLENVEAVSQVFNFKNKKEVALSILPLSHIFEQTIGFLVPFSCGIHVVFSHSHSAISKLLKKYKITKMLVVPEFLKIIMLRLLESRLSFNLFKIFEKLSRKIKSKKITRIIFWPWRNSLGPKLDTLACGGSALDVDLEKKWNAMGIYLLQGYGLTETSPVVTCNSYQDHKNGSVGKPVGRVEIRLAEDGEVLVKGLSVFAGYYKDEVRTKEAFTADGWFKTGDIGFIDLDGFLFIKGRKKYLIKGAGAQNVYPEDIETELNKMDEVQDSCVLGMDLSGGGVQIYAVLLGKNLDLIKAEKIIQRTNALLESYQQIVDWCIWPQEDFPRTATKKVKKEEVRKFLVLQNEHNVGQNTNLNVTKLQQLLSQLSGMDISKITASKKISDLNLDSLLRVELTLYLSQIFNMEIDESVLTPSLTVGELDEMLKKKNIPVKKTIKLKSWPRKIFFRFIGYYLQCLLNWFYSLFIGVKIVGLENLKGLKRPVIFMPNHNSFVDPIVLNMALPTMLRKKISYAAAQDFLYDEYWFVSWLAELTFNSFSFPRHEGKNINDGLLKIGQMLDLGFSVAIFPEGLVSCDGSLLPLKQGAGLIATEMRTEIIPVKIEGMQKIVPYDKFLPRRRGSVVIKFGKPIKFNSSESYANATERIEHAIKNL